ncbi:MAG: alpha/beta hydrolase [Bacteroidia bacterium]|nr:alpha/beta hydrolase [Bacteroidia bacterium]
MNVNRIYKGVIFLLVSLSFFACNEVIEPDTDERFFFRHKGADLAIQVDGNISSDVFVLLLHGGPGGSGHEYNTGIYSELLEEKYAMVYLDQRGQGASQGSYDSGELSLQLFSDDIAAVAQMLKKKYGENISLFLAGHSWGGLTGSHALVNTDVQANLKGWMEWDGAHDIPLLNRYAISMFHKYAKEEIEKGNFVSEWQEILDFVEGIDSLNVSMEDGGQINSFGFDAESYLVQGSDSGATENPRKWAFLSSPIAPAAMLSGNITAGGIQAETEAASLTSELGKIQIPSLFLSGKYDFVVPPRLAQSAFERVGTTEKEIHILNNSGHSPMDTEAIAFVQLVSSFIEKYK